MTLLLCSAPHLLPSTLLAEREREVAAHISSNGGRWRFGEEMARAIKVRSTLRRTW